MKNLVFLMLAFGLTTSCTGKDEQAIREAVNYQMEHYPQSSLQDLYKNFFQDVYGPGHLLKDTTAAMEYLRSELKEVKGRSLFKVAEATGYKNNFVRVDLYPVSTGDIPFYEFSLAFLESAEKFKVPDPETWEKEWMKILGVIESMELNLPGFEFDKKMIGELLERNEYVVHHSQRYIDAYHPHYRIIQKDIYKEKLEDFLD